MLSSNPNSTARHSAIYLAALAGFTQHSRSLNPNGVASFKFFFRKSAGWGEVPIGLALPHRHNASATNEVITAGSPLSLIAYRTANQTHRHPTHLLTPAGLWGAVPSTAGAVSLEPTAELWSARFTALTRIRSRGSHSLAESRFPPGFPEKCDC
ncbi:hypothetical protein DFH09DRAFT_1098819 [Mycena vulgaris]|nr:hypothetical protein DFH09DRAFT_1098819 [Mycena vulgaris]